MSPLPYVIVLEGKGVEGRYQIRLRLVRYAQDNGIRAAAEAFGCSRNTVRLWLRRFEEGGAGALEEKSRRPHHSPRRTSSEVEKAVVKARRQAPCFGPARLKSMFDLPVSEGVVGRILRERGLTQRQKRKYRTKRDLRQVKAAYKALTHLQMDVKYLWDIPQYWPQLQALGLPRYQYTIRDTKSGALALTFANDLSATYAWITATRFLVHLGRQGVDLREVVVQTDRGGEFSGQRKKRSSFDFTGRIEALGARHTFTPPRWPNANADVESSHRLIEREFYDLERYRSREDFLRKATLYQAWFNYARPNSYKGGCTPWQILERDRPGASPALLALPPILLDQVYEAVEARVGQDVSVFPAIAFRPR